MTTDIKKPEVTTEDELNAQIEAELGKQVEAELAKQMARKRAEIVYQKRVDANMRHLNKAGDGVPEGARFGPWTAEKTNAVIRRW